MAKTRINFPKTKPTILSHFRAKKYIAPKLSPRPTMAPTQAPTLAPTSPMNMSSKPSHIRRLFPGREDVIEAFFAGLDVEKIQHKYRIPSFIIKKILEKHQSKISKAKSRMGPKSQIGPKSHIGPKSCMDSKSHMGPKSQIHTDSIEDMDIENPASGKAHHARKRLFLGREQIIEASQKPDFDIEHVMQKYGITRFEVIRTLKKHQSKTLKAAVVKKSKSTKKEKKELGESRDLNNQEVCTRCDKSLGTWKYKECEEILCEKCYKVLFRQMFSNGT